MKCDKKQWYSQWQFEYPPPRLQEKQQLNLTRILKLNNCCQCKFFWKKVPIKQTSGVLFQALRFIHQRPIYLILFPSLALILSSSVPATIPLLSLLIILMFFSSNTPRQKIIPQFISRYKTDPNLPKNILIFFNIVSMRRRKKQVRQREEHHRRPKQSWAFRFFRRI